MSMKAIVKDELKRLKARHGNSWDDLSDVQKEEKLAARLFFLVCQNARVEAKSGDPLGEHIADIHNSFVELIHK